MNVPCTPSTLRETFRPSFDRTLNSTRLRPDGCKSRARVPSRRKKIPCRPPPKGKRIWVTERARKHGKNKDTTPFSSCCNDLTIQRFTSPKVECQMACSRTLSEFRYDPIPRPLRATICHEDLACASRYAG